MLDTSNFELFDCLHCHLGKQPTLSFSQNMSIAQKPFSLIHFDIWGPSPVATISDYCYFVIFVDDYSRFTWIYFPKHRSKLSSTYTKFVHMIRTQFSCPIQTLHTDNAMEYKDAALL